MPRLASVEKQLGDRVDDGFGIQPIRAVEIDQIAGLTEFIDAERADPVTANPAEP